MNTSVDINSSIYDKLQAIASSQNCDLRDCLEQALSEYIDNYGDAKNSDIESLNSSERAFFLSVAE